jgi:hypothetical protein
MKFTKTNLILGVMATTLPLISSVHADSGRKNFPRAVNDEPTDEELKAQIECLNDGEADALFESLTDEAGSMDDLESILAKLEAACSDPQKPTKPTPIATPVRPVATATPTRPVATNTPVKPVATSAPVQPVATNTPVKPVATSAPVRPVATNAPTKPVNNGPTMPRPTSNQWADWTQWTTGWNTWTGNGQGGSNGANVNSVVNVGPNGVQINSPGFQGTFSFNWAGCAQGKCFESIFGGLSDLSKKVPLFQMDVGDKGTLDSFFSQLIRGSKAGIRRSRSLRDGSGGSAKAYSSVIRGLRVARVMNAKAKTASQMKRAAKFAAYTLKVRKNQLGK